MLFTSKIKALETQLSEATQNIGALTEEVGTLTDAAAHLRATNEALAVDIDTLRQNARALTGERDELAEKLVEANKRADVAEASAGKKAVEIVANAGVPAIVRAPSTESGEPEKPKLTGRALVTATFAARRAAKEGRN